MTRFPIWLFIVIALLIGVSTLGLVWLFRSLGIHIEWAIQPITILALWVLFDFVLHYNTEKARYFTNFKDSLVLVVFFIIGCAFFNFEKLTGIDSANDLFISFIGVALFLTGLFLFHSEGLAKQLKKRHQQKEQPPFT